MTACGSEDPYEPEFGQRDATNGECPSGGTVLLVDGEAQATLCDGENGANGANGSNGVNGTDGEDGANGSNGQNAAMPGLVLETVFCNAFTAEPAPYRSINYKHARLYDGSLFVSVSCDTVNDQDASSDLFSSVQVGASSGVMNCALIDENSAVITIAFTPNFLTRRLVVTENSVVVVDYGFEDNCQVVSGS
jgi:hypothetical protein